MRRLWKIFTIDCQTVTKSPESSCTKKSYWHKITGNNPDLYSWVKSVFSCFCQGLLEVDQITSPETLKSAI